MKTENKIIKKMIEKKEPKTIREISKEIKSDYKITHTAVKKLEHKKIIMVKTAGKSTLCELNPLYYGAEIYMAENERKEALLKNKNISMLFKEISAKIKSSFFIFLVFGSYAKHNQTRTSDIDIMLISNDNKLEEKISGIISVLPIQIHPLVFTEKEFVSMKDSKEANVVKEAVKDNIILYGTEQFYRLKNA